MAAITTLVVAAVILLGAVCALLRTVLCALPRERDGTFEVKLIGMVIRFEIRRNSSPDS